MKINLENISIDNLEDGVLISLSIYQLKSFDILNRIGRKTNAVIELSIYNESILDLIIANPILLVSFDGNTRFKAFNASKLEKGFPISLELANRKKLYYNSDSLLKILAQTRDENVMILLNCNLERRFSSSFISGELLENKLNSKKSIDNWKAMNVVDFDNYLGEFPKV